VSLSQKEFYFTFSLSLVIYPNNVFIFIPPSKLALAVMFYGVG
jgi:hypothetical protein